MASELEALRWQFGLARRLGELHFDRLTDEACLWTPAPGCWTVRRADSGWCPDWAEVEPDPAPPASIGWLTWHLIWWSGSFMSAAQGRAPRPREAVLWPGGAEAAVHEIRATLSMWSAWLDGLDAADLARPLAYPWREPRELRFALAWANAELMKNVAEIGAVRHAYEASRVR